MLNVPTDLLPYCGVLIAAAVEGEIAYIAASALVAEGRLSLLGVLLSGAVGAAIGDQAFFYAFRGRLPRWLKRYPSLQRRTEPLLGHVRRHAAMMVLLVRFSPGLRIAITAACAWIDMSPRTFTVLNLLSAFVWAAGWLVLVARFGPDALVSIGLAGWKGALVFGLAVFGLLKAASSLHRRVLERRGANDAPSKEAPPGGGADHTRR